MRALEQLKIDSKSIFEGYYVQGSSSTNNTDSLLDKYIPVVTIMRNRRFQN